METIKLTLETEKKTSKIESQEEYLLDVGENSISIKVIAEDKSSSTYNLYITREEQKENLTEQIAEETEIDDSSANKIPWKILVPVIAFVVISLIGIVLYIIKRKLCKEKVLK